MNIMQMQKIVAGTSNSTNENFSYFRCMKKDMINPALTTDNTTRGKASAWAANGHVSEEHLEARDRDQANPESLCSFLRWLPRGLPRRARVCVHVSIVSQIQSGLVFDRHQSKSKGNTNIQTRSTKCQYRPLTSTSSAENFPRP